MMVFWAGGARLHLLFFAAFTFSGESRHCLIGKAVPLLKIQSFSHNAFCFHITITFIVRKITITSCFS
jgi:hypothetical protein